jgi:hypothetical protein
MLNESTGAIVRVDSGPRYLVDVGSTSIYSDGIHVWIPNAEWNSVTELNASSGALVRVIRGAAFGIRSPQWVASVRNQVWISGTNSMAVLNGTTGKVLRTYMGAAYGGMIVSQADHVWVLARNTVTELNVTTGNVIRVVRGARYRFHHPSLIATNGADLFVTAPAWNYVTEFSASSGALVRIITSPALGRNEYVHGIAVDAGRLWVSTVRNNEVSEFSALTGAFVRTLSASFYEFDTPGAAAFNASRVWIVNEGDDSVTEFPAI